LLPAAIDSATIDPTKMDFTTIDSAKIEPTTMDSETLDSAATD